MLCQTIMMKVLETFQQQFNEPAGAGILQAKDDNTKHEVVRKLRRAAEQAASSGVLLFLDSCEMPLATEDAARALAAVPACELIASDSRSFFSQELHQDCTMLWKACFSEVLEFKALNNAFSRCS